MYDDHARTALLFCWYGSGTCRFSFDTCPVCNRVPKQCWRALHVGLADRNESTSYGSQYRKNQIDARTWKHTLIPTNDHSQSIRLSQLLMAWDGWKECVRIYDLSQSVIYSNMTEFDLQTLRRKQPIARKPRWFQSRRDKQSVIGRHAQT